jgi:hypothetical protein
MLQEYYVSGAVLIDEKRYARFFGPAIDAARVSYVSEEAQYLREFPGTSATVLRNSLNKPRIWRNHFLLLKWGGRRRERLMLET